jgi:hypothetical protein
MSNNVCCQMTTDETTPLLSFQSHIDGKNATAEIWPDRIEWDRKGDLSALKLGMGRKRGSHETLMARQITSVSSERSGMLNTLVVVKTGNGSVAFRVSKGEAEDVLAAIRSIAV